MGQGQNIRSELCLINTIREINAPLIQAAEMARSRADERACRWAAQVLDCRHFRAHANLDISCGFKYSRQRRFDVARHHFNRAIAIIRTRATDGCALTEIGQAFPDDKA